MYLLCIPGGIVPLPEPVLGCSVVAASGLSGPAAEVSDPVNGLIVTVEVVAEELSPLTDEPDVVVAGAPRL